MGSTATIGTRSGRMVMQPTANLSVGGSIPGWLTAFGAAVGHAGFELVTYTSAVGCFTTRPLLVLQYLFSLLLEAESPPKKKPKLCVSVCLPAGLTD